MLYPVAENAEAALHAARGHAAREREARNLAAADVAFVTEAVGPAFATREAAFDAFPGLMDDDRPGRPSPLPESRWCDLRPVAAPGRGGKPRIVAPVAPVYRDGRRWPVPPPPAEEPRTLWRLSVSYWRIERPGAHPAHPPARKLRRDVSARDLHTEALKALADQPMRAHEPQQALDIGLFERRLPENPSIVVPDE